ncbi:MAG TPA: glutamate--tRNA ligase [Ktedonobacterales bacterium]
MPATSSDTSNAPAPSVRPIRTRFAPSPTGLPHIGNYRTAIFAWLAARSTGGQFLVRIEDTDQKRLVPGALDSILDGLRWLGLDWDEGPEVGGPYGPYFQSERLALYREHAELLLEKGAAYRCYCSEAELEQMRQEQRARGVPEGYDRRCRYLTPQQRAEREAAGIVPVVRFAAPETGTTTYHDFLRGDITVKNEQLDDMVLLKSDGYPTYNFANIVDDHLMAITHVIRGEEYISSAPRYAQVYRAFGWDEPEVIHVGLVLAPDRSKLSKRHGALPLLEYRTMGYLPQALVNYLVLLGWSYDDKTEFFTPERLTEIFDLHRIGSSPSIFDRDRLEWFNGHYIRELTPDQLTEAAWPFLEAALPAGTSERLDREYVRAALTLDHERLKTLAQAPEVTRFFFEEQPEYDASLLLGKSLDAQGGVEALRALIPVLAELRDWSPDALLKALDEFVVGHGFIRTKADGSQVPDRGPVFMLVRVAASGRKETPGLPETLAVLGKERTLKRLRAAEAKLAALIAA